MNRLILLLLLGCFTAFSSAAMDLQPGSTSEPIEVSARQLDADQQQNQATFSGEVVAKQGEITLYCDKLVVYALGDQGQVDRLEAFGEVRVVQLDRIATADRAVYRQAQGTLSLFGNARVHQGQSEVTGSEIIVYLEENRSLVKSGENGRVRAVFFPEQSKKQEKEQE